MSSTNTTARLSAWATTQQNVAIFVAIVIGLPVAYAFSETTGAFAPSFLMLAMIAIGVPRAYDEYWTEYDRTRTAVAWVLVASAVVTVEFVVLYRLGVDLFGLAAIHGGAVAFAVVSLGNLVLLGRRRRTRVHT